ncbi:MAG: PEP-CTERM sorting domain-containing protein [Fimbriiglobus sp.]
MSSSLVTGGGYTGFIESAASNPLGGSDGFGGTASSVTTNFALGTGSTAVEFTTGNVVQFRFAGGWDTSFANAGANWSIGSASVTFTPVPEPASVLAVGALATGGLTWLRRRQPAAV